MIIYNGPKAMHITRSRKAFGKIAQDLTEAQKALSSGNINKAYALGAKARKTLSHITKRRGVKSSAGYKAMQIEDRLFDFMNCANRIDFARDSKKYQTCAKNELSDALDQAKDMAGKRGKGNVKSRLLNTRKSNGLI